MAKKAIKKLRPPLFDPQLHIKRKTIRFLIHFFAWTGLAILFYTGFSFFFDTPLEFRMKQNTAMMREQYDALNARYDSLDAVLRNVVERDRNVFKILLEAEPYDFDGEYSNNRLAMYESLLSKSAGQLSEMLDQKTAGLEKKMNYLTSSYSALEDKIAETGPKANYIPAIQPVINDRLTLLTASYGMRIHPFYKTLASHQGVDYTVPEGSRVFATADGTVKDVIKSYSSSGLTVIISHGNGYETQYSHLEKANVSKGDEVKRGDIIALSGNSGLSLAPHLHYEIRHKGMRVDPIHYFFMELSPFEYQRISKIAKSGMQSFD